tara:strand:- start:52 stop:708 length:657 start_codon:yes stop_codon:yes gene_type:complete
MIPVMAEPICRFTLPNQIHQGFKAIAHAIVDKAPSETRRIGNGRQEHICNTAHQHIFKDFPEIKTLENIISTMGLKYIDYLGYLCDEVIVTDAWLNNGKKNSILQDHNHANSYISGTYYIEIDSKIHSQLEFDNHKLSYEGAFGPSLKLPVNTKKATPYNSKRISIESLPGQILFWKSHMIHGFSRPNLEDGRLTLSFNIMPKVCKNDGGVFSFSLSS